MSFIKILNYLNIIFENQYKIQRVIKILRTIKQSFKKFFSDFISRFKKTLIDAEEMKPPAERPPRRTRILERTSLVVIVLGFVLLYLFYIDSLSTNPPGFYVDESAISYNAYCIAKTGANEFGTHFPLFFPVYIGGWTQ